MSQDTEPTYKLVLDQFPIYARVCPMTGRVEKRPIDPPPVLHVMSSNPDDYLSLNHPNLHIRATLVEAESDKEVPLIKGSDFPLGGTIEQSIIKLKDPGNFFRGYFIFPDLSIRITGQFRIRFSLYHVKRGVLYFVDHAYSSTFEVVSSKSNIPLLEASQLTQTLRNQGVKIKVNQLSKRARCQPLVMPSFTKRVRMPSPLPLDPNDPLLPPASLPTIPPTPSLVIYHESCSRNRKPRNDEFNDIFISFLRNLNITPVNSFL